MLAKIIALSVIASVVLLTIVLQTTTPTTIGPLGILVVFIFMYIAALGVLTFLIFGGSKLLARFSKSLTVKRPIAPLSLGRSYYFSSVLALVPVMFIGMQSVGEVGGYDVLLVVIFAIMACLYISKRGR